MNTIISKNNNRRPTNADSANKSSSQSLLLIEQDEHLINRLLTVASVFCSVLPFRTTDEAAAWLNSGQRADLVIASQNGAQHLVDIIRKSPGNQFVPVLVMCLSARVDSAEGALSARATDLLMVDEDNHCLESKIRYYLQLSAAASADHTAMHSTVVHQFRLPWWKRSIDIGISLTVLLLLSPLLLVFALLIVLDSKGPIVYKSRRAGANYYIFNMYKFRTMKVQADQQLKELSASNIYAKSTDSEPDSAKAATDSPTNYLCNACRQRGVSCQQPLFDQDRPICEKLYLQESENIAKFMKFRNDPRITQLGTFLRNSSIDELPQLVNVLLGDMSLVGNRPLPLYEAEKLTADDSARRFVSPAGLTGIWQTKKRAKGQGPISDRERILLDIEYASTFSFKTDMFIIWKVFFSLLQKENV